uniref:Uncharacterized protein n=1 Tax=Rousettus aegyptiacus TaxID=9407 RepID=A0A7J8CHT7_ROUAE|nr:hypothetical protein HJG63_008958 [Rousettus aegyptiacus]
MSYYYLPSARLRAFQTLISLHAAALGSNIVTNAFYRCGNRGSDSAARCRQWRCSRRWPRPTSDGFWTTARKKVAGQPAPGCWNPRGIELTPTHLSWDRGHQKLIPSLETKEVLETLLSFLCSFAFSIPSWRRRGLCACV